MLKGSPASSWISRSRLASSLAISPGHPGQELAVDQHAGLLHRHQDRHQRRLDLPVDPRQIAAGRLVELAAQGRRERRHQRGALGGVGEEARVAGRRHLPLVPSRLARADRLAVEALERHLVQAVAAQRRAQDVGDEHQVEQPGAGRRLAAGEAQDLLQVVADDLPPGIVEPFREALPRRVAEPRAPEVGEDHAVAGGRGEAQRRAVAADHRQRRRRAEPGDRGAPFVGGEGLARLGQRRLGRLARRRGQLVGQGEELELGEQPAQRRLVGRLEAQGSGCRARSAGRSGW